MSQFVAIDIETTGLDQCEDHIIELAAFLYDLDPATGNVTAEESWSTVIEPGTAIKQFIFDLTGLKSADFRGAPYIGAVADEFLAFINPAETLVTYNGTRFDLAFLSRELGAPWDAYMEAGDHIDMLEIVKRPEVGKSWQHAHPHKLVNVHKRLCPGVAVDSHRALGDCHATAEVHAAINKIQPGVFGAGPDPFLSVDEVMEETSVMRECRDAAERYKRAELLLKEHFKLQHPGKVSTNGFEVTIKETKGRKRLVKENKHLIPEECYEVGPGSVSVSIKEEL